MEGLKVFGRRRKAELEYVLARIEALEAKVASLESRPRGDAPKPEKAKREEADLSFRPKHTFHPNEDYEGR